MSAVVRVLLMWLLVVALPMQGVAAATMQFCGPGHHPQRVQAADDGHVAAHADEADAHHALSADKATGAGDLSQHGKLKCSACAACCAGSALPPAAIALPFVKPTIERVSVVPPTYVGPDALALEKPPRYSLA